MLTDCQEEIAKKEANTRKPISHSYITGLSTITNARPHKNKKFVFNADLKDFFPSINFGRVRGLFINHKNFELDQKIATIIAHIVCENKQLPKGAPTSPIVSNLIGNILDIRLLRLARMNKCYYTRYADDLTFSTSITDFPSSIAVLTTGDSAAWVPGPNLVKEVQSSGFIFNQLKTRMQIRPSRQTVTGLIVNYKINIPVELYKASRSMCHSLFQLGFYKFPYVPKASSSTSSQREIDDLRPLESLLGYIYHVRITGNTISGRGETSNASTGINKIRSRLLFYKNFVAHSRTVVVCEEKTDPIYLKCALSRLDNYRNAFQMNPFGTGDVGLNFLKFTKPVSDLLDLGGGVKSLKVFIKQYSKNVLSYKHRPLIRPTIILIDNDQGAVGIFSLVKKLFGVNISHQADDHFYYLLSNLYLIKTPELGDNGMSCIEDLFEQKVLGVKLGDATFSLNKKHAADDEYGKNVLAESVVKPNKNNISFINFSVLFDRIGAVEEDYITRLSSVST